VVISVAFATAAQVHENVTVELIEVPVYVFGPDGQPIRGLTKDNFELRINRRQQPIEYFDAIDFSQPKTTAAAPQGDQRERRLYLLLFDQLYSAPPRLARAQRAAEFVVEHSNPATDLFAVATYTAKKGVQFATPFLVDRVAIRRAIGTLTVSSTRDPFSVGISPAERMTWDEKADASPFIPTGKHDEEMEETLHGGVANQEMQVQPDRNLIDDFVSDFGALAKRLAQLQGQKHLVVFSEGFRSPLMHGGDDPVGKKGAGFDARLFRALDDMVKDFQSAGVFLDTVDIAGLRHLPGASYDNDSLQFLAHQTGGEFVHNRNDLGPAVADLANAERVVYVLAFNRRNARGGTIDVRVNGIPRGSRVSFRHGFGATERSKQVDPLQLADILINDVPQSGLNLRISASPSGVTIELPRDEIVPQLVDKTPNVDTFVYVFDQNGSAVFAGQKTIAFDSAARKKTEPIVIRHRLDLAPGHYVAKAIARIAGTTSIGFARAEVTVP